VGEENELNDIGYIDPKSDKFKLFTKDVPIKFEFNTMN